eukprot:TRINITY_DN16008_c0_g1_i1.p1 TRINITY_DN16008_c0_g1~~TRINITY_DN16008_c0_g1_i1.p1  ORF type:complete len:607 (-),score=153.14 TRINITY_DN16008_c0_g1_i1:204-2024(-)
MFRNTSQAVAGTGSLHPGAPSSSTAATLRRGIGSVVPAGQASAQAEADSRSRDLFRRHCGQDGAIGIDELHAILEIQRVEDGLPDPLPKGYVKDLFAVWNEGADITEERFVQAFRVYLRNREAWFRQWGIANNLERRPVNEQRLRRFLDGLLADQDDGSLALLKADFQTVCERWAAYSHQPPPPPGFSAAVFVAVGDVLRSTKKYSCTVAIEKAVGLPQVPNDQGRAFCSCKIEYGAESVSTPVVDYLPGLDDKIAVWHFEGSIGSLMATESLQFEVVSDQAPPGGSRGRRVTESIGLGILEGEKIIPFGFQGNLLLEEVPEGCQAYVAVRVEVQPAEQDSSSLAPAIDSSVIPGSSAVSAVELLVANYDDWLKQYEDGQQDLNESLPEPSAEELAQAAGLENVISLNLFVDPGVVSLGWAPASMPPGPVLVASVQPGSWAQRQGLRKGDRLMSVEGRNVEKMQAMQLTEKLKQRPVLMHFVREIKQGEEPVVDKPEYMRIELVVEEGTPPGLGFTPNDLPPKAVCVAAIEAGSWAARNGVRIGDRLAMVDGRDVFELQGRNELGSLMRKRPVDIVFEREAGDFFDEAPIVKMEVNVSQASPLDCF